MAMQSLTPIILEIMKKQIELDYSGETSHADYGAHCLKALTDNVESQILPHLLPFVQSHIQDPVWQHQDAALHAFGFLVSTCSSEELTNSNIQLRDAIPIVIGALQSP